MGSLCSSDAPDAAATTSTKSDNDQVGKEESKQKDKDLSDFNPMSYKFGQDDQNMAATICAMVISGEFDVKLADALDDDLKQGIASLSKFDEKQIYSLIYQYFDQNEPKGMNNVDDVKQAVTSTDLDDVTKYVDTKLTQAIKNLQTCKATGTDLSFTNMKKPGAGGVPIPMEQWNTVFIGSDIPNTSILTSAAQEKVKDGYYVVIEAGAKVVDVETACWPDNSTDEVKLINPTTQKRYKCLANRGGWNGLSIIGMASAGAMGFSNANPNLSGYEYGSLQSIIRSMRVMTVEANEDNINAIKHYQIEPSTLPIHDPTAFKAKYGTTVTLIQNDDTFSNWATAMGTYGVILYAYIEVVDAQFYQEERKSVVVEKGQTFWEAVQSKYKSFASNDAIVRFEMWFSPYNGGGCLYSAYSVVGSGATPSKQTYIRDNGGQTRNTNESVIKVGAWASMVCASIASVVGYLASTDSSWGDLNKLTSLLPGFVLSIALNQAAASEKLVMSSVQALSLGVANVATKTITGGYGFPMEDSMAVVQEYCSFLDATQGSKEFNYITSPLALRFAKKSVGAMSVAGEYDAGWMEVIQLIGTSDYVFPVTTSPLLDASYSYLATSKYKCKLNWGLYFNMDSKEFDFAKHCFANIDATSVQSFKSDYVKYNSSLVFCNEFTIKSGMDHLD